VHAQFFSILLVPASSSVMSLWATGVGRDLSTGTADADAMAKKRRPGKLRDINGYLMGIKIALFTS